MISEKDITTFRRLGLHLCPGEICSQYHGKDDPGKCNLDNQLVFKSNGCENPENCYKLVSRGIKIKRLN